MVQKTIYQWTINTIADLLVKTTALKFDGLVCLEARRGLGKSTLAFHISRAVNRHPNRVKGTYHFIPERDIIFTQQDMLNAILKRWYSTYISDEAILVAFNRDSQNNNQKKIIKALTSNRDHRNIIFLCLPSMSSLDKSVRNMVKLKITIIKRGLAVIQTPQKTIYNPDPWDTYNNEKIERKWIDNGSKPNYTKLTTFRGFLKFPALTEKQEELYQRIKVDKRNQIMTQEEEEELSGSDNPLKLIKTSVIADKVIQMIATGEINDRSQFELICKMNDKAPRTMMENINKILKDQGQDFRFKDILKGFEKEQKTVEKIAKVEYAQDNVEDDYIIDRFGVKHKKIEIPNVF